MIVVTPSVRCSCGSRRAGARAPSHRAPTAARRAAAGPARWRARARARCAAAGRPRAGSDTCAPHPAGRPASAARRRAPSISRATFAPVDQPVGDVVGDRQVGEQRVRLEHDAVVARGGRRARCRAVLQDAAAGLLLEPRDDAQQRRLAAARRPEEADQLARLDRQVDRLERDETRRTSCGCLRAEPRAASVRSCPQRRRVERRTCARTRRAIPRCNSRPESTYFGADFAS